MTVARATFSFGVGEIESRPWGGWSVIEVQPGELLAEFDIVRLQDGYRWTDEA